MEDQSSKKKDVTISNAVLNSSLIMLIVLAELEKEICEGSDPLDEI